MCIHMAENLLMKINDTNKAKFHIFKSAENAVMNYCRANIILCIRREKKMCSFVQ